MSMQSQLIYEATNRLDATRNISKAITKGYSIVSISMACFLLFGAFMDEFSQFNCVPFEHVNLATPKPGGNIESRVDQGDWKTHGYRAYS